MTRVPSSPNPAETSQLRSLFAAILDGTANEEELQECEKKLREEEFAREYYLRYVQLHVLLEEKFTAAELPEDTGSFPVSGLDGIAVVPVPPSILLDTAPAPRPSGWFTSGGTLFSYAMSALVMAIGLLIAWSSTISRHESVAKKLASPAPVIAVPPASQFVARITGAVNCRQAEGAEIVEGTFVTLGEKFMIADGLLEVTYTTGARVLLEGPCAYKVESPSGGYLSLGKLAARVESGGNGWQTTAPKDATSSPSPSVSSAKFYVRTPTALVEDLGTEFAVEVEKTGNSRTHVFQGKVELRVTANGESVAQPVIPLVANESASVVDRKAFVVRSSDTLGRQFVRRLPQRVRVKVFNSGVGLKEGDFDPHWQIVTRSDIPNFQSRQAVVTPIYVLRDPSTGGTQSFQLPNDPAHSAWISLNSNQTFLPSNVVFTFRTTFDLKGLLPNSASLWGRIIADDSVAAIRLNGKRLELRPPQPSVLPFYEWRPFSAADGFVAGKNVLEVDVLNGSPTTIDDSLMSCRVELDVSAVRDWRGVKEGDGK